MNKRAVMVEALVVAFGWAAMSGKSAKETATEVVSIFDNASDPDHQRERVLHLLRLDHLRGRAGRGPGNARCYERQSLDYRQLYDDMESFREVLKK